MSRLLRSAKCECLAGIGLKQARNVTYYNDLGNALRMSHIPVKCRDCEPASDYLTRWPRCFHFYRNVRSADGQFLIAMFYQGRFL